MIAFSAGERVFLPGASGEPTGVLEALFATPGVEVLTTFVPGVNRVPPAVGRGARVTGLFGHPGAVSPWPVSYGGLARWLQRSGAIDTAVLQVSPPDAEGRVSLGPAVEFSSLAFASARRRIAVINGQVAFSLTAPTLLLSSFDEVEEHDAPIRTYGAGAPDGDALAIAGRVAGFIEDGAVLQMGLGKVPAALAAALHDRRSLRLRSGMLSDGVHALSEAGALAAEGHLTTVFLGSADLYAWAAQQDGVRVAGCEITHDPASLAVLEGFVAVNSALEVDLFGQANLEMAGGAQVSGCGGAPDFARAAVLSPGGLSILALPSTFGASGAGGSRITASLGEPRVATLPRHDVDVVVTEHGAADLRGRSVGARAEALISVAAPVHRGALAAAWSDIARRLRL